jgi:membrane fusion protein, multidrug efflux system
MASTSDPSAEPPKEPKPAPREAVPGSVAQPDHPAETARPNPATPPGAQEAVRHSHPLRRLLLYVVVLGGLASGIYELWPAIQTAMNTVSTDDAYVNGHVTFVAPRVSGQVSRVLVDDNYRVKKGALLVQLDKEPYQVQVEIAKSALAVAETNLAAAEAQVRSLIAQGRANRYQLQHAIEDVHTQIANLRANVATLKSREATLALARANLKRGRELAPSGGISKEDLDQREQASKVDEATVDQALQVVYATRVGLGLPAQPPPGHDLGEVPDQLDQTFSAVSQAMGQLLETTSQFGYVPTRWDATPKEALEEFYKQDPAHDIDKIVAQILPKAPAVKQAVAKRQQARADLDQALLNLRYCDVSSEIDGVVTRRNINPGNNVQAGQSLMVVRSLTEIWIDANFKETQLADLRIGHRVRCEVDMYGKRREYEGRITGFTMGTGQTLSLLPPQNATGNFVKIVQRLPVRVELTDYDPDKAPLFVGLSVVPYVYYKEPPTGPHAGDVLQPIFPLPPGPTVADDRETARTTPAVPGGRTSP